MDRPLSTIESLSDETELQREIAALEHELRRVRDGLERNPSHALEQRARQLRDNIEVCKRELRALKARSGAE